MNAASLAMSDAGIPMKGIVAAATCSIVDGQPVVDVNQREETDILPRLTVGFPRCRRGFEPFTSPHSSWPP